MSHYREENMLYKAEMLYQLTAGKNMCRVLEVVNFNVAFLLELPEH